MNASKSLAGKKIALLATDGFEYAELTEPKKMLEEAGAAVEVIAPGDAKEIKGWKISDWSGTVKVDRSLAQARPDDYEALLLPGGVINPDKLRMKEDAVSFVRAFGDANKPIAAICHGPWTLINAGQVKGRTMTSWPSVKQDLENAGAHWEDREVVRDGNLITSRKPDDIPAFGKAFIALLAA
ncbi:type 1 glutamine amidotransferase [Dyella monticola]|uniref:Type 1 glutamine amidotransferase n=1 Tax=Dyella monticola TaxID=1927958 RepID=A0A370X837_9GAMM|nr:type 1 glutamine amidotransferase domain-containing protein [Dyella monticola]RDS84594.1 type 1 glutamine amidotransferase [Dyella monticola]